MSPTVRRRTVSERGAHAWVSCGMRLSLRGPVAGVQRRGRPGRGSRRRPRAWRAAAGRSARPSADEDRDVVRVGPEARARLGHVVRDEEVDALAAELVGGPIERAGLGGEPDEDRPRLGRRSRRARAATAGEDVLGRLELEGQARRRGRASSSAAVARPEVGDGRGHDQRVRAGDRGPDGAAHLGGRLGADDEQPSARRQRRR